MRRLHRPDPELIEYLRAHLEQFGPDALRMKLLEEGVAEDEIDDAFEATRRPPAAGRKVLPFVLGGAVCLALLVLLVLFGRKPAGSPAPVAGPADTAIDPSVLSAPAGNRAFHGHSGYVLQLPLGYVSVSDFKDPQRTMEVVYLCPKETDPTNFGNEGIYAQLGILRLEASPRRISEGRIGLEQVRAGVSRTLQGRKATFTMRDVQVGGLQALVVSITEPFPLAQAFILGTKVVYVLTGGAEDAAFTDTLASLREVS